MFSYFSYQIKLEQPKRKLSQRWYDEALEIVCVAGEET